MMQMPDAEQAAMARMESAMAPPAETPDPTTAVAEAVLRHAPDLDDATVGAIVADIAPMFGATMPPDGGLTI